MIGTTIGRYRIVEKLGEGGMGAVWRAEDPVLGREVAIKLLPESAARSSAARERLLREARAACALNHPGIATVYEAGEDTERVYLVFELVDGETVAERVKREGPLPEGDAIRIAREVAEALGHAHGRGVLHRDVTSGNVMLDRDGRARIVDFGLAVPEGQTRVTRETATPGTVGYIAPEIVRGEKDDRRSDLYGLGVVLYEMLTGHLPFERDRAEAVLYAALHEDPTPPRRFRTDLSPDVEGVVLRAIAREPERRFGDADEMIRALRSPSATGGRALSRSAPSRRPVGIAVSAAAVVIAASLLFRPGCREPSPTFDSIAVLPLRMTANPEDGGYLAGGIGDAVATRLSRVSGLRVSPWVTSSRYPADALPLPDIAAELNVESLLVGQLREENGRLFIRLSLREGRSGESSWEGEFEDSKSGLLELQEEICRTVARRTRGRLAPEDEAALGRRPTDRVEAWDHYLRGAAALQAGTRQANEQALAHFETALAIDPRLAEAHVGTGAAMTDRYHQGWGGQESVRRAEESFRKALEIDPQQIRALRGLIHVYWLLDPNEECLRIAKRIRDSGEVTVEALVTQAEGYFLGGLPEYAVPLLQVAIHQDPVNRGAHWLLVLASAWSGEFDRTFEAGEEYFRKFGEDPEVHFWIAGGHRCRNEIDQAVAHYERSLELFGDDAARYAHYSVAAALGEFGDSTGALRVIDEGIRLLESRLAAAPDNELTGMELFRARVERYRITRSPAEAESLRTETAELRADPELRKRRLIGLEDLASAMDHLGDPEAAEELLREAVEEKRTSGFSEFTQFWLRECFPWILNPHLPELPGFQELLAELRREHERRRDLYGS